MMRHELILQRARKYGYSNIWDLKTFEDIQVIYKRACDFKDFEAMKHVPMFMQNRMAYDRAAADIKQSARQKRRK